MSRATASGQTFLGVSALVFAAGAAAAISRCMSMPAMSEVPMPGGWMLSMTWTRMCGGSWAAAAAAFVGMWVAMTAAMMLPSLVPMLRRYRKAVAGVGEARLGLLTALAGAGYFAVWTAIGAAAFPLGAALAAVEMRLPAVARAVPLAVGAIVLIAGVVQFSVWKAHQLACCRNGLGCGRGLAAGMGAAWRYGLRLGLRCSGCCAGLTATLLAVGIMDWRAMTLVTAAITAERLAPAGERVARMIGAVAIGGGLFLIAQAIGLC